jgi:hypothetical protein
VFYVVTGEHSGEVTAQPQPFEMRLDPITRRTRCHGERHTVRLRELEQFDDPGQDAGRGE